MATQNDRPFTAIGSTDSSMVSSSTYQIYHPAGISDLNPCVGGSGLSQTKSRVKNQRKEETLASAFCAWIVEHQFGRLIVHNPINHEIANRFTGISINLLLLLFLTHASFPRVRQHTRKFFELSYYDTTSGLYTQGWDDFCFVFFGVIVFTGLRVAVMDYVLMPLAQMGGIQKKKVRIRFAEQAWLLLYDSIFWSLGMVRLGLSKSYLKIKMELTFSLAVFDV